jgi:hypothetical protein
LRERCPKCEARQGFEMDGELVPLGEQFRGESGK